MQTYKNITVIGTSHIALESIRDVEANLLKIKPEIIALELDKKRFYSLLLKRTRPSFKDIRKMGIKGWLFSLIGSWIENKLGESIGIKPGSEMKKAIEIAKKLKSKIALIDQDIEITLKKLSKRITWKEKFRFIFDIIKGIFVKPKIKFDLRKVPDEKIIKELTNKVRVRYPSFYITLVKERDIYMANALNKLIKKYPDKKIFAIVGAGHEKSIINLIKNLQN